MPRPETVADIDLKPVEIGRIELARIADSPELMRGYVELLKHLKHGGARTVQTYGNTVNFERDPDETEQAAQLAEEQNSWDQGRRLYSQMADVGRCEYSYEETLARQWAEREDMEFPPHHEPYADLDVTEAS